LDIGQQLPLHFFACFDIVGLGNQAVGAVTLEFSQTITMHGDVQRQRRRIRRCRC
jgi:aromatic ring-opening dioxygenase LigB subunit